MAKDCNGWGAGCEYATHGHCRCSAPEDIARQENEARAEHANSYALEGVTNFPPWEPLGSRGFVDRGLVECRSCGTLMRWAPNDCGACVARRAGN